MKNWLTQTGLLCIGVIAIYSFIPVESKVESTLPPKISLDNVATHYSSPKLKITDNILSPVIASKINAGLLLDITTNEIIWQKNLNVSFPVASLTKMMVALLTLEDIREGKIDWETKVTINTAASLIGGSQVYLKKNEVYTVEELLKGAMISSGNDAAYQLADFLAGSQDSFVIRMNIMAEKMGMSSTKFFNTTGLPSEFKGGNENSSTPSDLSILVSELLKYDELLSITNKPYDILVNGKRKLKLRNHNLLVNSYSFIDGLKTGYTCKAGFCIAVTATIENHRVVAIVLGSKNRNFRDQITLSMLKNYNAQLGDGKTQGFVGKVGCL
ncbi:MAG: hypothetical protein A3H98_04370 [Bacteroidetes bacterium RIFCSPLOWO2_02_FULL_36_8]|nr:MAG: hypothetical protein A3H98_04370 [Bacteroidetes bacterium RIFCSPLOWO2_02_FULL_36_8]OFY68717.1 MAG: hypothetical protein A3G23_02675 [Bacteroidetes bacterium RIFCSPLOWO2_12_FULL_37_12]